MLPIWIGKILSHHIQYLTKKWIPSLDGADEMLSKGITFGDIGCGHGYSSSLIAQKYTKSKIVGIDPHEPSISEAIKIIKTLVI